MKEKRKEKRKKENFAKKNICRAPCIVLFKMLQIPGRGSKTQAQFTKSQIHCSAPAKQSHHY